jgi:tyrosyl-tRNA synthetase
MPDYFQYATDWPPEQIADVRRKLAGGELHPNTAKRILARTVVDLYHGAGAGAAAEAEFDRVFKDRAEPEAVREVPTTGDAPRKLSQWMVLLGLAASNREAARQIRDGAVKIDGVPVTEDAEYTAAQLDGRAIQNGKRKWARLRHQAGGPEAG